MAMSAESIDWRHPAQLIRHTIMVVAVMACLGCAPSTSDSTGAGASIAGTWKSSDADSGFVMTLTLSESGSAVTGIGNTTQNPPWLIDVSGAYQAPNVDLILTATEQPGQNPVKISFSGTTTSPTTMAGTMSGGGLPDHNATFTKQ